MSDLFSCRSAEILYSLSAATVRNYPKDTLYEQLVSARRNLSLYQHHDGVTGTAKDHVVVDYGEK